MLKLDNLFVCETTQCIDKSLSHMLRKWASKQVNVCRATRVLTFSRKLALLKTNDKVPDEIIVLHFRSHVLDCVDPLVDWLINCWSINFFGLLQAVFKCYLIDDGKALLKCWFGAPTDHWWLIFHHCFWPSTTDFVIS